MTTKNPPALPAGVGFSMCCGLTSQIQHRAMSPASRIAPLLFLLAFPWAGQAQNTHILEQADAPIIVYEYSAETRQGSYGTRIVHSFGWSNRADTSASAVEVGIVSFNPFREPLDIAFGLSMEKIEPVGAGSGANAGRGSARFAVSPPEAFSFYTGVAFVSRVRFADGRIWKANSEQVVRQIREVMGTDTSVNPDSLRYYRRRSESI